MTISSRFGVDPNGPQYSEIEIARIDPNPAQPRRTLSDENAKNFAEHLSEYPLQNPIVVVETENKRYVLASGQRRLRAFQSLNRTHTPAMIFKGQPSTMELAIIEN